jgi:hypothetical protein
MAIISKNMFAHSHISFLYPLHPCSLSPMRQAGCCSLLKIEGAAIKNQQHEVKNSERKVKREKDQH